MTGPILTLSTLEPERPFLTIDGTPYQLRVPTDLTIIDQARLQRMRQEFASLQARGEDLGEEEIARAEQLLRDVTGMVVMADAEVLDKLNDTQRVSILQAFPRAVAPRTKQPRKRTSARRSPASRASTAPTTG